MVVSIHQPNYLPWLGFFNKIKNSDLFVIMDDVQFPRGKKHFGHRNQIRTNNGRKWLTLPIKNRSAMLPFNRTELNYSIGWQEEHLNLIDHFYRKAPFYDHYIYHLRHIINEKHESIASLNIDLIRWMCYEFGIRTNFVVTSYLAPNLNGFDTIKHILKETKATKYISGSGPGSKRYLEQNWFDENNVKLEWQDYVHPVYNQRFEPFEFNLSAIDLLMNEGGKVGGQIL